MKKYFNIALLIVLAGSLSSCLKDKYNALNPDNSPSVVEFKNPGIISSLTPAGALFSMYTSALPAQASVAVTYTIQLSGENPAKQDVNVALGTDPSAVARFNLDQKQKNPAWVNLDLPDAALYSFATPTAVIKAGTRSVDVVVNYKTASFDFTKKYVFPLAIKSTSFGAVSKNFGTILLNISAKNSYDGIYAMKSGFFQRYAGGVPTVGDALNGTMEFNADLTLSTIDANTVEIANLKWGSSVPNTGNAGGVGGIDNLQMVIDPATNLVTMKSLGNSSLANTIGLVNKYDPATKTFTLNFNWGPPTGSARVITNMQIKYKNPRP